MSAKPSASQRLLHAQIERDAPLGADFPRGQAELANVVRQAPEALTRQAVAMPTADLASQRLAAENQVTVASTNKR